jgi:hypothetical protein
VEAQPNLLSPQVYDNTVLLDGKAVQPSGGNGGYASQTGGYRGLAVSISSPKATTVPSASAQGLWMLQAAIAVTPAKRRRLEAQLRRRLASVACFRPKRSQGSGLASHRQTGETGET